MSDNKYPVESYSVDDILREVREMRSASAKPSAVENKPKADVNAERTERKSDEKRTEQSNASATARRAEQSGDNGAKSPDAYAAARAKSENAENNRAADSTVDNHNANNRAATNRKADSPDNGKPYHKPSPNTHDESANEKTAPVKRDRPNEMHDAPIPHIRPRANVITPDEINSGFATQPIHIAQKRKPKVITADELRQSNDEQSGAQSRNDMQSRDDTHSKNDAKSDNTVVRSSRFAEVDVQSEGNKLNELFADNNQANDSTSAKEKIDELYGTTSNFSISEYYETTETKAERKARLKAEREEEKIRKAEQKAAEKLRKKLAKSKAAANDDDYSDDERYADSQYDGNTAKKVNPSEFFTIENDSADGDKTRTFDAVKADGIKSSDIKPAASDDATSVFAAVKVKDERKKAERKPDIAESKDKTYNDTIANDNANDSTDITSDNSSAKPQIEANSVSAVEPTESAKAAKSAETETEFADNDKQTDYANPPKNRKKYREISPVKIEPDEHGDTDEQSDVIEDYRNIDDAETIRSELNGRLSAITKRGWLTFIMAALLGVLTLLPCFGIALPDAISPEKNIKIFLTLNAVFFALAIIINIKTVINGILSMIRLRPDIDTAVSISAITCAIQLGYAFYQPQSFASGTGCLYTAVCAVAMLFNLLGKRCMFLRVRSNFDLIATTGIKQSCYAMNDEKSAVISDYLAPENTTVVCQRPVINLHNFISNSFCEDLSDRVNSVLAPLGLAASLIAFVITYLKTADMAMSIGCLALTSTACVPLTAALAANRPLRKSARRAAELGGLITGYSSVESFADTEYAVVNDYDLFSSGSIELLNLKAVGDNSIDDVIMDAAALAIAANSPLKDVFERMIVGRMNFLKPTENIIYTDGKGLSGTVGGDKFFVGNRKILDGCSDINLPDIEFERKIERKGCFAVYIARNNELCGMLVVRYTVNDEILCEQLQNLTDEGVALLVKTCDPNITERLICGAFSLDENTVHVLPSDCAKVYDEQTLPRESGDSLIAHRNSLAGYASAIFGAKRLKFSIMLGVILQTVGAILGFAAALYFSLIGGYNSVLPSAVLIYQLICSIIVTAVPSFRKV